MSTEGPEIGAVAPDFALESAGGTVRLSDQRGRKVVLSFYNEDATPTCQQQTVSFKDEYGTLEELGAKVLGISVDDLESHRRFVERLEGLPYPLLVDAGAEVARRYGVADETGRRARNAVYVVDENGVVALKIVPYLPAKPEHFMAVFEAVGLE